jgi:hypothetical protein
MFGNGANGDDYTCTIVMLAQMPGMWSCDTDQMGIMVDHSAIGETYLYNDSVR